MFTVCLFLGFTKDTMVSIFGLLYIIANLKISSWDLQEKYSTQWERKKERVWYCQTEIHNLFPMCCKDLISLLYIKCEPEVICGTKVIIETLTQP